MKSIQGVKKCINLVRNNSLPFLCISLMTSLGVANSCLIIINEHHNVEKCLVALKEIVVITLMFACIVDRSLNPYKGDELVELIESEFLIKGWEVEKNIKKWGRLRVYYKAKTDEMVTSSRRIAVAIVVMYFASINRNIFNQILEGRSESSKQDWPTFFVYWTPETTLNSGEFFVYLYCFQALLILFYSAEAYCLIMSVCLATERVLADYETIGFLLGELVRDFPDERDSNGNCVGQNMEMLREDMRRIVWCHQSLNRNFKNCADNSAFPILMTTCVMCVDTCMNIYILLEADDLETIINYAVICVFINVTIFFSYNTGQRISNQSDIFRQSLADVPWIGKPKWFKQALVIMMLRTNIDNQMKPYGIYVLNYLSFKDVMRAAFTFGHFLYTTKMEKQAEITSESQIF